MRILLCIIYIAAGSVLQEFVMREIQNDDTVEHCEIFIAKPSLTIIITCITSACRSFSRVHIAYPNFRINYARLKVSIVTIENYVTRQK